ncbi:hypothetical protein [Bdellovibrio sp. HCB337]|uniref:hypothetical protein n=1 Tax=Bdellovibrio sp. HCB337 TaxID=3394358 RepID=UPI0039A4B69C
MKRSILLFVGALMVVMFQNCAQNVNFKPEDAGVALGANTGSGDLGSDSNSDSNSNDNGGDNNAGNDSSQPAATPIPNIPEYTESFKVSFSSESAPLDMMWVIDNSGSMAKEAEAVRKNFDAFLTALNKTTNFRLLLVSLQSNSGYGVMIPSSFDPSTHKQINQEVGSTNGPSLLISKLKTLPQGYFRTDSKKIVVFVTDDNSSLSSADFTKSILANNMWNSQDVSVSSFIGIDAATSPCMAKEGKVYKELASQTAGRTYNICMADWSAAFNDLLNSSVSKAVRRFAIPTEAASIKKVLEVKVDGVVLASNLYSFEAKAVTLSDSVSLSENSQVLIRYQ